MSCTYIDNFFVIIFLPEDGCWQPKHVADYSAKYLNIVVIIKCAISCCLIYTVWRKVAFKKKMITDKVEKIVTDFDTNSLEILDSESNLTQQ